MADGGTNPAGNQTAIGHNPRVMPLGRSPLAARRVYAGPGNDVVIRVNPSAWKWTIVYCGRGYDRLHGYNGWLMEQHGCEVVD